MRYKTQYCKEKVGYMLVLILVLLYVYSSIYINNGKFITNIYIYIYIYVYIVQNVTDFFFTVLGFVPHFK